MTTIARTVDRDKSLPHQIIIGTGRHTGEMSVSCNCRKFGRQGGGYSPMGFVAYGDGSELEALKLYNQPGWHNKVDGEPDFHPELNNYQNVKNVEVNE
jgi:hypothetical protein